MSPQTAKFILHRNGLSCFSLRELSDMMRSRHDPLPEQVKNAIVTLRNSKMRAYV